MRIPCMIAALALGSAAFSQQFYNVNATLLRTEQLGHASTYGVSSQAGIEAYNNITTFSGSGYINNGAVTGAAPITNLVADDLTSAAGTAGKLMDSMVFSTVNFGPAAISARPRLRFWLQDGAGNGPGTLLAGFTFNPLSLSGSQLWSFNPGVNLWAQNIWAGMTFDNNANTTGATAADLNNLGQLLYNPPAVGSSADVFFQTTGPGSWFQANPPGGFFNFGGNPKANFGWEIHVTPEPGAMAAIGLGLVGLLGLRRRK